MRARTGVRLALALAIAGLSTGGFVTTAQTPRVHAYVGMVADVHRDGPDDLGLLPTAVAEAQVAAEYAGRAAKSADLDGIKLNTRHVLHALDPRQTPEGPGLGYGVRRAAAGSAETIEMAAKTQGASPNVVTHANHIATSARNTVERADKLIVLAKEILAATSVAEASKLVNQLNTLVRQLTSGVDANGDGQIGWQKDEGGLSQAQQHMALLKKGEGLP